MKPVTRPADLRLDGLDVARALAILGMFCVHAGLVLSSSYAASGVAGLVLRLCDGRAAATFITLAGIGVERFLSTAGGNEGDRGRTLRRRAAFLGALGVLNLVVWPGDILRLYGVALLLAPALRGLPTPGLLIAAVVGMAAFPPLAGAVGWESRWDFETLTYNGLWEPTGFLRNLFIDGFRPVLPWLSFFLLGMWLGRLDLGSVRVQQRLVVIGALALALTEAASTALVAWMLEHRMLGGDAIFIEAVAGTGSMPPMPLFMIAGAATAALVVGGSLWAAKHLPVPAAGALVATGRLSLTWYLLHIVLLVLALVAGFGNRLSPPASLLAAATAFATAVFLSSRRHGAPGPVERAMRTFSAPRSG